MADPSPHAFAMPSGPPHNPESASVSIRDRAARARAQEKARRKNAPRACVICAARKVSCDAGRPCIRCVKAGKEDQCVDVITKRRRKVVHDGEGESEEDYDDYAPSVVTRASARQHAAVLGEGAAQADGPDSGLNSLHRMADVALSAAAAPAPRPRPDAERPDHGLHMMLNAAMAQDAAPRPPSAYSSRPFATPSGPFDPDVDRCMNVSLWNTPIPVLRVVNSSVVHGPTKRSVFCNKAALELFGFTSEEFNEFLTTGNTSQLIHPESLLERMTLHKECIDNRYNFARFDGRFLRKIRSMASGAPQFASFRATEVINFTYDEAGVPFSILSYYVDIRPPEELPHEWQQYLDGTKTVSPLAVATSSRVAPTVAGGLSGMSAVTPPVPLAAMGAHAAPPPGYVMVPLAAYQQLTAKEHQFEQQAFDMGAGETAASAEEVPGAVITDVDQFWKKVFMEPLARTLDRVYDECGSVLPTPVADAMNYLSSRPMSASTTAPVAVSTAVTTAVTATPSDGAPAVAEPEAKRVRVESFSQAPGPALAAPAHTSQSAPDSHTLSAATLAASPEQGAAYPAGYTATATPTIPAIAAPGRYSTQGYPQQEQGWGYSGGYRTPQGYGYPLPGPQPGYVTSHVGYPLMSPAWPGYAYASPFSPFPSESFDWGQQTPGSSASHPPLPPPS